MIIKEMLKSNKYTYYFIKKARKVQFVYFPYIKSISSFNLKRFLRVIRINRHSPYEKLKSIKNKHHGERCFIVATGPSLTIEDLEKLEDEITIGMNSICLAFDDTDWRPTYYGIQDEGVYDKMRSHIEKLDVEGIFVSDTIPKALNITLPESNYMFPLNMLDHNHLDREYHTKFSNNIFSTVNSGYTITYCLIQIAVYMGFKEIYLLGADCHYGSNMRHHFKDYDLLDPTYAQAGDMMTSSYKVAREYCDKHNIKIFNATRGGMLEVFERVNLDEVLAMNNKESLAR